MNRTMVTKFRKLIEILSVSSWRRALLRHKVAAGVEHLSVLWQLGDIKTVVDVGANRGQFSLVARECFRAAKIFAFEPLPGPATVYRAAFNGDSRAILHETAIGPREGRAIIHISAQDDSSSLLPIAPAQDDAFPGTAEIGTSQIDVTPLSLCLPSEDIDLPALLKLDVQGFELQALVGCENLLTDFDWVYVECSFIELYAGQCLADEVIAWLRQRGFSLHGVFNIHYHRTGRALQADFLFRAAQ